MNTLNNEPSKKGEYVFSRNTIDKPIDITQDNYLVFGINEPFGIRDFMQHRKTLPAFIGNGSIMWYRRGLYHNINGPAIIEIYNTGSGSSFLNSYRLMGKIYSKDEWRQEVQRLKEEDK